MNSTWKSNNPKNGPFTDHFHIKTYIYAHHPKPRCPAGFEEGQSCCHRTGSLTRKKVYPFHCSTPGMGWPPRPQKSWWIILVHGRPPGQCHTTVTRSASRSSGRTGVEVCTGWNSLDLSPPWTRQYHPRMNTGRVSQAGNSSSS